MAAVEYKARHEKPQTHNIGFCASWADRITMSICNAVQLLFGLDVHELLFLTSSSVFQSAAVPGGRNSISKPAQRPAGCTKGSLRSILFRNFAKPQRVRGHFTANQGYNPRNTYPPKSSNFPFKKSSTRSIRFRKSGVDQFLSSGSLTSFSLNNISPFLVSNQLAYFAFCIFSKAVKLSIYKHSIHCQVDKIKISIYLVLSCY